MKRTIVALLLAIACVCIAGCSNKALDLSLSCEDASMEYVNSQSEFKELYGEDFEVEFVGGNDDLTHLIIFFGLDIYKGTGRYIVDINGDEWVVESEKSYFDEWTVTGHHRLDEESK